MNVGKSLERGLDVFRHDALVFLAAGVTVAVLGGVTLGVLGGPLYAGLFGMALRRLRDGKTPAWGDVFSELNPFGRFIVPFYVLAILIAIGMVLLVLPGVILATVGMFVFPLMLDRRTLTLGAALSESARLVRTSGAVQHFALVAVLVAVHAVIGAGLHALGRSWVLAAAGGGVAGAFGVCCIAAAYLDDLAVSPPPQD